MMRVLIIGAGGHGLVIADILLRARDQGSSVEPIGFLDDNLDLRGQTVLQLPVYGRLTALEQVPHDAVIVAIGNNRVRYDISRSLEQHGERLARAHHPRAIIAPDVRLASGTTVCAGAIANPGSEIGAGAILNTGCSVDHQNRIGQYAHISPGSHLGGEVWIGEGVLVGIGATVLPRVRIGAWTIVGAGSVVHRDLPAGVVALGVPAKVVGQASF